VAGQPLVHERVVGRQQLEHAPVLADLAADEELGLALQRLAQVVVELGERVRIRSGAAHVAQVQPLVGEVGDQRLGARVGQHAPQLRAPDRGVGERAGGGAFQ
jgi:hypothetical protein